MIYHSDARYQELISTLEDYFQTTSEQRIEAIEKLNEYSQNDDDQLGMAVVYFHQSRLAGESGKVDLCRDIALKAVEHAKACNSELFLMKSYNSLGISYSEKAQYFDSLKNYLNAYYIATKNSDFGFEYIVLNNIGNLFVWLEEYETAESFMTSAYEKYIEEDGSQRDIIAQITLNIIELHSCAKSYDKVYRWMHKEIIKYKESERDLLTYFKMLNDITRIDERVSKETISCKIIEFADFSDKIEDFSYVFRSALKVLEVALERANQDSTKYLIRKLETRREGVDTETFDLNFIELVCTYVLKYNVTIDTLDNSFIAYYQISKKNFKDIKSIYSESMLVEIKLSEERALTRNAVEENALLQMKIEKDPFTQLYNKSSSFEKIKQEIKNEFSNEVDALIVLDIDHFKMINDSLGHDFGDIVILKVADILRSVKEEHIAGRYGGDEFILFVKKANSLEKIEEIARDISKELSKIVLNIKNMQNVTCSIGISLCKSGMKVEELFKCADIALYESKQRGRNGFTVYRK